MRLWRFALLWASLGLCFAPALVGAGQLSFDYGTAPRTIRACTLLLPANRTNPNPYVLPLLARSDLRPAGWTFVNPLAPTNVTAAVWNRWLVPTHSNDPNDPASWNSGGTYWDSRGLPAGSPLLATVPPEWPQYWEVELDDVTADQLAQFDLIYTASATDLEVLTGPQQAALRRAVENGAVLWVDNAGGQVVSFPVPRCNAGVPPFTFQQVNGTLTFRRATYLQQPHELLASPFYLSSTEIGLLGFQPTGTSGPFPYVQEAVGGSGGSLNDVPLTSVVALATGSGSGSVVSTARYGAGAIVITSEDVGQEIERWYGWGLLQPMAPHRANYKFAYNVANLAGAWGQARGSSGNRSLTLAPARAPLDLLWQFPAPWGDGTLPSVPGPVAGSTTVSGGRLFVLSTLGANNAVPRLWCLSAVPSGVNGYQVLWSAALPGGATPRSSSPTACTIGGTPAVIVAATDLAANTGVVTAYRADDGTVLWTRTLTGFAADDVVDLATPLVFKDWVFVLATDYDASLQGGGIQGTYGRVHVFDVRTGGDTGPAGGTYWVYPDSTRGELAKLLPPFHDATWAGTTPRPELPPDGDVRAVLCSSLRTAFGLPVEAALLFHSPVQLTWDGTNIVTVAGDGEEYAFVPTPANAGGPPALNPDYFAVRLAYSGVTGVGGPATRNDASATPATVPVSGTPRFAPDGGQLAWFNNGRAVLGFLATLSVTGRYANPLVLREGCSVLLSYTAAQPITDEAHVLPGPVAWRKPLPGRSTAENGGRTLVTGSRLTLLDSANGRTYAQFEADTDLPPTLGGTSSRAASAPALDAQSALVKLNLGAAGRTQGAILGLRTQPDLAVHLGPGLDDALSIQPATAVVVSLRETEPPTAVPSTAYSIDYPGRVLRFRADPDPTLGTLAGKAIVVDWTDSAGNPHTGEMHVIPASTRFTYVGGFLKLRYYPVLRSTVSLSLPEGTAVQNAASGEPTVLAGANELLPNGWMDLRAAFVADSSTPPVNHPVAGKDVLISYRGWSEADQRFVTVGTVAGFATDYPAEQQQVPVEFGLSQGGVALAGQSLVVPTLGVWDATAGSYAVPRGGRYADDTLLSLFWDPVGQIVRGYLSRPSVLQPGTAPATITGTPTAYRDRVYVGTSQEAVAGTPDVLGYVGCLGPRRTLICDGNRLVEAVGGERTWTLTGTQALVYGRTAPEPTLAQPLNRPAKAAALTDGNLLIADTGNNRVLIVDRAGNQLWPLDEGLDALISPYDYYSSPARTVMVAGTPVVTGNSNLSLSQPADAYRYTDALGAAHTIIADTGHNRVVDVISYGALGGPQTHQVVQLTPDYVRPPWAPTQPLKLRYTRAQPIFDFGNGAVIGYLCAAANIDRMVIVEAGTKYVDPDPTTTPPGGTRTWADWSWLYNLQFSNLRHVEYSRFGNRAYVTAVAGGLGDLRRDGVWIWALDTAAGLVPGTGTGRAVFEYTSQNYANSGALTTLTTPAGVTYQRRFYPVCAKVLYPGLAWGGNVMVTNYGGLVEQLARENVGSAGSLLAGEVLEIDAAAGLADNQRIIEGRTLPDPWQQDWNDPLNQPAYAERY